MCPLFVVLQLVAVGLLEIGMVVVLLAVLLLDKQYDHEHRVLK
jgi:hypothetical protein